MSHPRPAAAHRLLNPEGLAPPVGYSHVVVPVAGRTIYVGGQTAHGPDGIVRGETVTEQFEHAVANLAAALEGAEARPEHLVSVQIFVTDASAYRDSLQEVGDSWRRHLGRHYPAVSLFEVSGLFDPAAVVELVAVAVVPD